MLGVLPTLLLLVLRAVLGVALAATVLLVRLPRGLLLIVCLRRLVRVLPLVLPGWSLLLVALAIPAARGAIVIVIPLTTSIFLLVVASAILATVAPFLVVVGPVTLTFGLVAFVTVFAPHLVAVGLLMLLLLWVCVVVLAITLAIAVPFPIIVVTATIVSSTGFSATLSSSRTVLLLIIKLFFFSVLACRRCLGIIIGTVLRLIHSRLACLLFLSVLRSVAATTTSLPFLLPVPSTSPPPTSSLRPRPNLILLAAVFLRLLSRL